MAHDDRADFPRSISDLTSRVTCPACFSPLTALTCATCGLDLAHPAARELAVASEEAAAALRARVEIIGRVRAQSRAVVPEVPVPTSHARSAPLVSAPAMGPAAPAPAANAVAEPVAAPPAPPRRHLGVQVILLIVAISLLSAGAIAFLVFAFVNFGLVWRSLIIGTLTIASFVGASILRRRSLTITAEAIGVLAMVFVYLDAYALRANDFFSLAATDGQRYWGVVLLASSLGFLAWHRLSHLRVASIVAFLAFPVGLALLVASVVDDTSRTTVYSAFLALAVGGLVHSIVGTRFAPGAGAIERITVLAFTSVGLVVAGVTALEVAPSWEWAPTPALALVAGVAFLHAARTSRPGIPTLLPVIASVAGAIALASAVAAGAVRSGDEQAIVFLAPIAAVAVALALESLAGRVAAARTPALIAAWCAAGVAALTLAPAVVVAVERTFAVTGRVGQVWALSGWFEPGISNVEVAAVAALLVSLAVVTILWAVRRVLASRAPALAWAAGAVLVLAAPLAGVLWTTVLLWIALATAAVVTIVAAREQIRPLRLRAPLAVGGSLALALGYGMSWASSDTWLPASLATIVVLVLARRAIDVALVRAALLGVTAVLALIAAGAGGWRVTPAPLRGDTPDAAIAVTALALVLLALGLALIRRRSVDDVRALFWVPLVALIGSVAVVWWSRSGPDGFVPIALTSAVLGAVLLGVLVAWAVSIRTAPFTVERTVVSLGLAPVAAWFVDSLALVFDMPESGRSVLMASAATLVAGASLALAARHQNFPRWAADAGVAVVVVLTAIFAGRDETIGWLVLLIAAVGVLLIAFSPTGLVGSDSSRKHLGWLALALATAGLWWRLWSTDVTALEAYVLPLAGALLLIAVLTRRQATASAGIALGGMLVATLPLGLNAVFNGSPRATVLLAVFGVLLAVGSVLRRPALQRHLDAAAIAGGLGGAVLTLGRAHELGRLDPASPVADAWLVAFVALIVVALVGQALPRTPIEQPLRRLLSQVLVVVAIGAVVVVEIPLLGDTAIGITRGLAVIGVLAAIHVLAFVWPRAPLTPLVAWAAIGGAALTAVVAVALGTFDPGEIATLPVAVALLVSGTIHLRRSASSGSWPWLAPGVLVLLLPSLFATFVDQPAWRLVALGLAAVAVLIVGAVRRLQAPLILGAVIVLIHALRTFAPQLRWVYESTQWWVWAVVGGAIVLFVALTFERRVRDLKTVMSTISALR